MCYGADDGEEGEQGDVEEMCCEVGDEEKEEEEGDVEEMCYGADNQDQESEGDVEEMRYGVDDQSSQEEEGDIEEMCYGVEDEKEERKGEGGGEEVEELCYGVDEENDEEDVEEMCYGVDDEKDKEDGGDVEELCYGADDEVKEGDEEGEEGGGDVEELCYWVDGEEEKENDEEKKEEEEEENEGEEEEEADIEEMCYGVYDDANDGDMEEMCYGAEDKEEGKEKEEDVEEICYGASDSKEEDENGVEELCYGVDGSKEEEGDEGKGVEEFCSGADESEQEGEEDDEEEEDEEDEEDEEEESCDACEEKELKVLKKRSGTSHYSPPTRSPPSKPLAFSLEPETREDKGKGKGKVKKKGGEKKKKKDKVNKKEKKENKKEAKKKKKADKEGKKKGSKEEKIRGSMLENKKEKGKGKKSEKERRNIGDISLAHSFDAFILSPHSSPPFGKEKRRGTLIPGKMMKKKSVKLHSPPFPHSNTTASPPSSPSYSPSLTSSSLSGSPILATSLPPCPSLPPQPTKYELQVYGERFTLFSEEDEESEEKKKKEEEERERERERRGREELERLAADNWIERFHSALGGIRGTSNPLSMSSDQLQLMIQQYSTLIELAQDFIYTAKAYGRIIISERFLARKTIVPIKSLGGQAGGEKYIVQNILFKFAVDSNGMYQGDFAAAKVAGLELKGSIAYFNAVANEKQELRLPMIALVDYFGFRLIAISLLPIGEETLVYGTGNAGKTIYASDEKFNGIMEKTAARLNISSHYCGSGMRNEPNSSAFLHSAADVEGHRGKDGHYYLLDFSRTMPPCPPDPELPSSHLYRLFRTEFVARYPVPLCSDGFSGFLRADPNRRQHNAQLRLAFTTLLEVNCHEFARRLQWRIMEAREKGDLSQFPISQEMHSEGINLRYLGVVLSLVPVDDAVMSVTVRSFLMCEILARVIKNEINALLRDSIMRYQIPMEARYRSAVVEYLNFVLIDNYPESTRYWDECLKPLSQRFFSTQAPYTEPSFPLKNFVLAGVRKREEKQISDKNYEDRRKVSEYFIRRIASLAAVQLSGLVVAKVLRQQPLNMWDLEGFSEQVKHMNIIADATGNNFAYHGLLELKETGDYESAGFYFRQAIVKYKMALQSNPNNPQLLEHLAICLAAESIASCVLETGERPSPFRSGHWPQVKLKQSSQSVQEADQVFLRAFDANSENSTLFGLYAEYLGLCGRLDRAENYYLRSLTRNPDKDVLKTYIELVTEAGHPRYAYLLHQMLMRLVERGARIEKGKWE